MKKDEKCVLCGQSLEARATGLWKGGNNPAPLRSKGRACDVCDREQVIPRRIANATGMPFQSAQKLLK